MDKLGVLTFDVGDRRLTFKDGSHDSLDVHYNLVDKVVFDVSTHMRGITPGSVAASVIPTVGVVAGPIARGQRVQNYWFYLGYKGRDQENQVLLEVDRDSYKKIIDKANSIFGPRVKVADYQNKGEQLDPAKLPDVKSKDTVKVEKDNHPLPEPRPDKALVVVVCPPLGARSAGHGNQFKLHANDRVIAVNKAGTYSFAYLDPGKYRLVSQSENAYGFEMELEAGKTYYFLQNTFQGVFKNETSLSRNSPELVSYLVDGSYYSDWKAK